MSTNNPQKEELIATAKRICTPGKGILAADESIATMGKRFAPRNIENNEVNRQTQRELLVTSPGIENYISGIIFHEETLQQKTVSNNNRSIIDIPKELGIVIGIKVDKGVQLLEDCGEETCTLGIDNLKERSKKQQDQGARFCKWRAVIRIDKEKGQPSMGAIEENAHNLARYAVICQNSGLVPIIEPEILGDGIHNITECVEICEKIFACVFNKCSINKVLLEGALMKPNMITPGFDNKNKGDISANMIADYTMRALSRTVPSALPGIFFLSGGQSEEDAAINLNAINVSNKKKYNCPWRLSFSQGRALQKTAIETWDGKFENIGKAQMAFIKKAEMCGKAQLGQLDVENIEKGDSLYEKNQVQ